MFKGQTYRLEDVSLVPSYRLVFLCCPKDQLAFDSHPLWERLPLKPWSFSLSKIYIPSGYQPNLTCRVDRLGESGVLCVLINCFFQNLIDPDMALLFLTHLQSLEFALYLEILTTTLLMDGHLTFREHVSTFWRKTAPPLPRPFRCW